MPTSPATGRPLKPVWIEIDRSVRKIAQDLKLKAVHYHHKVTVDETDLVATFDDRVSVRRSLNTDTGVVTRHADFDPPLGADDVKVLARLADNFQRQLRRHRRPLKAPGQTVALQDRSAQLSKEVSACKIQKSIHARRRPDRNPCRQLLW